MTGTILLTGGTGFIGSHTAVELIKRGYEIVIADNLSNSCADVIGKIGIITGVTPRFYKADVCDRESLRAIFSENDITEVIHFAGLKAVGESVIVPLSYYRNNIDSALSLLEVMDEFGVKRLIFSSSATVYTAGDVSPITEDMPTGGCTNPYGWTKYMIEQIIRDKSVADSEFSAVLLRYFNPIGAHESGLIGEKPNGIPSNIMPTITQTAAGKLDVVHIFGGDWPTKDGTGVRDYIHISDLAAGHAAAIDYARTHTGAEPINLGTGTGYSVLELIRAFERVNGVNVNYDISSRRAGDLGVCYASAEKAERLLGWHAVKGIDDMVRDAWMWEKKSDIPKQT